MDASGSFGCGGILVLNSYFQLQWPSSWASVNIVVKELIPIVVAAALWGRIWYKSLICFHTDNIAVVAILRNRTGSSPIVLHLLQCLYFYTLYYQLEYIAEVHRYLTSSLAPSIVATYRSAVKVAGTFSPTQLLTMTS